jgi:hypothetical protein
MHWQVQEEYLHPCPTGHVGDKASQAILISNATILRLPNIRQPQFHRGHPPPKYYACVTGITCGVRDGLLRMSLYYGRMCQLRGLERYSRMCQVLRIRRQCSQQNGEKWMKVGDRVVGQHTIREKTLTRATL